MRADVRGQNLKAEGEELSVQDRHVKGDDARGGNKASGSVHWN